MLATHRK